MKITALETIQLTALPNFLWLQVHTDEGLVGLGECQREPDTVAAYMHSTVAPYLLGKDPQLIERHNAHLAGPYLGFESTGAEIRAASAVDIALWDIAGQAAGRPIHQLLGGLARDSIAVYNTCAGYDYNRGKQRRLVMPGDRTAAPEGPYDDQVAFMNAPAELAASLIDEGFGGMKIWPFDPWAAATGGTYIALDHLKQGVAAFEAIRRAVGDRIELMCELHSLWNLPSARRIAKALEPYGLYWIEDPLNRMNNVAGLAELAAATPIAIAGGETLASPALYRDLLNARALAVVIADIGWCGGISKARRIAALAEAYQRPIALHDCSGPVVLTASVHLSLSLSNALFQEVVRAFVTGWYGSLVTELPRIAQGHIHPMPGAGLGTRLKDSVLARPDLVRRRSALS